MTEQEARFGVAIVSPDAPRRHGWVRLVVVSDTHDVAIDEALFPPGDLLIHAGDHTKAGLESELHGAAQWLRSLAPRFTAGVLAIGGNHDRPLDTETWLAAAPRSQLGVEWNTESMLRMRRSFEGGGLRWLQHSVVEVAGLKCFGSPYTELTPRRRAMPLDDPQRHEGFLRESERLAELFADITTGLDVLITHGPPLGTLDASVQHGGVAREKPIAIGSAALRDRLAAMRPGERPRLHVFGHEHDSRGAVFDASLGMVFVNAAAVDGDQAALKRGGKYTLKSGFRPWVIDLEPRARR